MAARNPAREKASGGGGHLAFKLAELTGFGRAHLAYDECYPLVTLSLSKSSLYHSGRRTEEGKRCEVYGVIVCARRVRVRVRVRVRARVRVRVRVRVDVAAGTQH